MGLFSVFKKGLQKTATAISRTVTSIFTEVKTWDETTFSTLENALLEADFGADAAKKVKEDIKDRYQRGLLTGEDNILKIASDDIAAMMQERRSSLNTAASGPTVILMVGVNGSGKTTTIGKLAAKWKAEGKKVILGACDTFRAAAVEQLQLWGERTGCQVISSKHGADPASVAFDATMAAKSRGADILLIDTAGRQQNQQNLMAELNKICRSIGKVLPGAPHEVWLTVDASLGANVINQAREFGKTAGVSGLVLTKLDGTGRGGMAVALHEEFGLPTFFAGFGEAPEDLQEFDPEFYANALFGLEK